MRSETGFDPALLDRFPTSEPRPEGEVEELKRIWAAPKGWGLLTAVNNNYVGFFYVATAFLFFLLAGILALVVRVQLALPLQGVLPQETYNQFFTMHGTVMMFLFAVPMVEAIGVMLLPQMLAARDLPFPRLSAYAFWAYFVGGLCFFASLFVGLAPDGGWFMYPPYTSLTYSPGINADFWLLGIGFIEISAIAGAIEIIVGVLRTRAPGMSLAKMPVYAWAMLVMAVMIIIAFPAVILGTLLLEIERAFNWPFFDPTRGGDALLWQHLFWFFGHPEVYIIFLPASGLVSMMVVALARAPLVGHSLIVLAFLATGFISFGVWAHHMFTTGMPNISVGYFSAASMAVSVPAGIQIFSWIATFAVGKPRYNVPTLFVIGGLVTFVLGGLTGVMVAMVPFDWQAHDSYFIVAHLHYVLIGGMVFPLFAAFYYWTGMTSSRPLSERLGQWAFWLMFVGMQVTFLPMHLTGLMGMPRRVYTYLPGREWEVTNMISTVGAFVLAAGVLAFLVDLARNFRFTVDDDAGNVYGGGTLEWLPTGLYSTRSIPVVRSREPLWDDPKICEDVEQGRYLLPNAPTGLRETIITSPLRAEPEYLQIMPGPSPWPLLAAIFTAGFFLLLTVQAYTPGFVSGVLAILCTLRWLWDTDRVVKEAEVDVGAGIMLPTYVTGPRTHGWWAMVILLIVIGMIFAMAVFSFLYLYGVQPSFWIAPAGWQGAAVTLPLYALAAGLALGSRVMLAREATQLWTPGVLFLCGSVALAAAVGADIAFWHASGLRPDASGQGAIVYMLLTLTGLLAFIGLLMAGYIAARNSRGMIVRPRNNSLDLCVLFVSYAAGQGALTTVLTRAFGA
ncbi:cytochrome ubiquinol oxidase subunit I [Sphingomonas koreensis]|jgi:cytochrome c oxidase subunit I+III|uniref:Cytochrome ubiquinol oxidase subunit I n=1 Tax=Sphingomonas koreensis TaxID=93064 RepID=A0A1L6JD70_9SPHN|nr:cbb3-type cytochrome c oxidase subunit I [Sphingomonas koreensis]APR53872.1 cytochrome ubiquinol oxidase subunit I [Sphingomonas koreensis]MDC7808754.1 cbb3-type cytochrome c oxidase subunit I [Sphingomonas koreensis]RSU18945.1 cytochrome ubiquinol oxidase subunit I [Sphingomonas koreensis]RSU24021.1 cytochrome ubiquinol oxidase subunit I [Sphingomonas koreensis]RSU26273.1 cytochrome ubiquinol oxidase subunit I [Sphingomonas koreensis]